MLIITLTCSKGGVGKTATTKNLAQALVRLNQKVAVVDQDPQANLSNGYNPNSQFDLINVGSNLSQLQEFTNYDFILIDTPPTLKEETASSYLVSDYVLIPTNIAKSSMDGIFRTIHGIQQILPHNPKLKVLGVFVNSYNKKDREVFVNLMNLRSSLQDIILKSMIRDSSNIKNADDKQLTVQEYELTAWSKKSTEDFDILAKEILSKIKLLQCQ